MDQMLARPGEEYGEEPTMREDAHRNKLAALKSIDVFRDLSEAEMIEMERSTTMSTCEAGRIFYGPEEFGEVLFLLKKGRVQVYRLSPEGKKLIVAVLDEGSIFGEMSLLGQGMHNTYAEAAAECLICIMDRKDIERIIKSNPMVAIRIMESMAKRLHDAESQLEDLAFRSIPTRLSALLLRLASESPSGELVVGHTHQDLAEMLGTYRETVTQTLNSFKHMGWIDIRRKEITILDASALQTPPLGG
jgi:CRP-like cAMP-binding protein